MFIPPLRSGRPLAVLPERENLGFISRSVEIPGDMVITVEYSTKSAQMDGIPDAQYQMRDPRGYCTEQRIKDEAGRLNRGVRDSPATYTCSIEDFA